MATPNLLDDPLILRAAWVLAILVFLGCAGYVYWRYWHFGKKLANEE